MSAKRKDVSLAGAGLVFGTAFGYLIGTAMDNIGLGIALGAAFGLLLAPVYTQKEKSTHSV